MKNILVIYYSQTGQSQKMVEEFVQAQTNVNIHKLRIDVEPKYMFPWKIKQFFRLFPLCVRGVTPKIKVPWEQVQGIEFDKVVIAYQVWFLSPSLPAQALLKTPELQVIVRGKTVLGLVSARNMWVSAVDRFNQQLKKMGSQKVINFVLCDQSPTWATFVTTPRWLLTGKREPFWIFPKAGIADEDYLLVRKLKLTESLNDTALESEALKWSHKQLPVAYVAEKIGINYFKLMAAFIQTVAPKENLFKDFLLLLFRLGLVLLIVLMLPISAIIVMLMAKKVALTVDRRVNDLIKV